MKRICLLLLLLCGALAAQPVTQTTWPTLSATGTTTAFSVGGNDLHTVQVVVSGSPDTCTVDLDGSLDGTHWFGLDAGQTCTSSVMYHIANKMVLYVRGNVSALSGGSAPTVTITYAGQRTGGRQ